MPNFSMPGIVCSNSHKVSFSQCLESTKLTERRKKKLDRTITNSKIRKQRIFEGTNKNIPESGLGWTWYLRFWNDPLRLLSSCKIQSMNISKSKLMKTDELAWYITRDVWNRALTGRLEAHRTLLECWHMRYLCRQLSNKASQYKICKNSSL